MRAIDERWEEVNVRATNTLENIEEDDLDEKDPSRKRRGSNPVVDKRREAGTFVFFVRPLRVPSLHDSLISPATRSVQFLEQASID